MDKPTVRLVLQIAMPDTNTTWRISGTFNFADDMTPGELAAEMEIVENRVCSALGRIDRS